MIINKQVSIARIYFPEGSLSQGTKVFLSDGSELIGVTSVTLSALQGALQEVSITAVKGAEVSNEQATDDAKRNVAKYIEFWNKHFGVVS